MTPDPPISVESNRSPVRLDPVAMVSSIEPGPAWVDPVAIVTSTGIGLGLLTAPVVMVAITVGALWSD